MYTKKRKKVEKSILFIGILSWISLKNEQVSDQYV